MHNQSRECSLCGGIIPAFSTAYTLKLQLFAEGGTLHLTPDDLAEDHETRTQELIEEAENRDPDELMDEVWESYTLTLCVKCRHEYHETFIKNLSRFKDSIQ